jgi:hypothetical protein
MDNFFEIDDIVYVPSKKVIGKIIEKKYTLHKEINENDYFTFIIEVDKIKTLTTFNNNESLHSVYINSYETIKLLESKYFYSKTIRKKNKHFDNLLKPKDAKLGAIVEVVDNSLMERILKHKGVDKIYNYAELNNFIGFKKIELIKNPLHKLVYKEGYFVYCKFYNDRGVRYTLPVHIENIVLIKKSTYLRRLLIWWKEFIKEILD